MRTKTFSAKRLLSLLLTVAMFATMILPTSVFAVEPAPIAPTAMVSAVDNGDGTITRTITISFGEKIAFYNLYLGQNVYVDGKDDAFGTSESDIDFDDTGCNAVITLGPDYTVAIYDTITFEDDCIKYYDRDEVYFSGDVVITEGSFEPSLADFTALNEAIVDAEAIVKANFTPATVAPFEAALATAKAIDQTTVTNQTTVNDATTALENAMTNLLALADFTELNEAIEAAEDVVKENYTATSVASFENAYDAAKDIDQVNTPETEQSAVDAATSALNNAINNLVPLANFDALNDAIEQAGHINPNDYTAASFAVLTTAVAAANNIDQTEESVQANVDNAKDAILTAIAGLVGFTDVTFTATAVADNVSVNYAKANKIIVVFGNPLKDGAEAILEDKINVDATVSKINNSVYVLELDAAHTLTNGITLEIEPNEEIFAADGKAINACSATVFGNLESAAGLVTADEMTATIVNVDDKPYMVNGDKIVLVFNAPVYDNPTTITVSGMVFTVVANTDNTVYVRELDATTDSVVVGQLLEYGDIQATLKGTFGGTVVPEVVRALVEDVDGTAKTAGDKINVFFNVPTNKAAGTVENTFTGVLAGATGEWLDNQTLVITLGETPITITDKIDLSNLGIKDFYGTEDADADDIELEGSFGVAVEPKLLTVTAISKSGAGTAAKGDEIHLSFNVKMREDKPLNLISDFDFDNGNFGSEGATVAWAEGDEYKHHSTIIITLGKEPTVIPGETTISIKKELFEESGIKSCDQIALQNRRVTGTFGATIAPELLSASIVKTKPVVGPQNGDKIVLLFNTPTNGKDIDNLIKVGSKSLGTGYSGDWDEDSNNTIYVIELGSNPTVAGGDTIEFDNDGTLKDINGQKQAKSNSVAISGSFGEEAAPVGISPSKVTATIVKGTTIAGPQAEDKIVFAFNVATNGSEALMLDFFNAQGNKFGNGLRGSWNDSNTIYTLYLGTGATVTDGETITFTSQAGIQDKDSINAPVTLACTLIGSFGVEIKPVTVAPSLLDAVIIKSSNTVGATKGDKIQFIFNMAINDADLYAELGGANVFGAESNGSKENNIYTITIGNNANIPASFSITAAAGLKDAAEFSEAALIPNIVLTGSFGDEIKPVTAAPTLFKAVIVKATDTVGPQAGDKIQLVFNMAINDADLFAALGGEAVFGTGSYGSAESNVYTITLGTGITSIPTTFSINSDAELKDASGYSANAVIPNFTLVGSFGIVVNPVATKPALKNAVIIKDSGMLGIHAGDKIVLIFNVATNGKDDNINLINNIDFPGRNEETLGLNPTGRWISDIEYEITLGEGAAISEAVNNNAIIKFNHHNTLMDKAKITAASEIEVYKFEGSFGVAPELTLEKAIIVKGENNTVAKAQKGDMIILSFSSKTNAADIKAKLGTEYGKDENGTPNASGSWSNDDTVYTITLGDNPTIADAANFSIPENTGLAGIDGGVFASNAVPFEGSFGKVNTPAVISAVAYSDVDNDYIDITFNIDTNTYLENQAQGKYIFTSATTAILGNYSINWSKGPNVLTIILGNNHTFVKTSEIEFTNGIVKDVDELGVLADNTKVTNVNGELRKPYVTSVVANYDEGTGIETLTVTFSSKTNKPDNIDLSAQSSSLGIGATASWTDTKTLVITLGAGRTISVNGTGGILLNGLGITNGFDTNEVVGQYSITAGALKEDNLKVVDARVNRRTNDSNVTEDFLTVSFNAPTNMYGKVLNTEFNVSDIEANIDATKTFGASATAKWESASRLVIKLGADSTFKNANDTNLAADSKVTFKNLKFANGLGAIVEEEFVVTGSFDGREVKLNNIAVATANEYTTATVTVDKQEFNFADDAIVTFVIWDATKSTVTDMNAVKLNMAAVDTIEVSSKFAAKDYSKVEVYVTDAYIDAIDENTTFDVLANTVTANKAQ